MYTGLLLVCLVSPIVNYIGDNCIPGAAPVKFELESQCEHYVAREYAELQTSTGQDWLRRQMPLYNENRWKVRAVCTKTLVDDYLTEVAP